MSTSQIVRDRVVGERKALLYPNRPANSHANVDVENRYPCTTILIHGVNDLGTDFGAVESGLCEGLNDRLGRSDLKGGEYTHGRMANDPSKVTVADLMKNLDDVIYRRQEPPGTKSVVIPFYWGFKASASDLAIDASKQTRNGQYIDKFGNRLDKHRAKGGGMFAKAGTQSIDQLEAETALSVSTLQQMPMQSMSWPGFKAGAPVPAPDQVANVLNQGKDQPDDRCKVLAVNATIPAKDGQILVIREESPSEAKVRLMNDYRATSTYHSAVMSGQRNHRSSTAFDVSIGQARALDDPRWAKLLRAIADWRISLDNVQMASSYHSRLDQTTRDVVEASCRYYQSGDFPSENLVRKTPPPPVVSEMVKVLNDQLIRNLKSNSINNASLF
ncbi:hypothetical protein bAD24_III09125 [Burkholderia sp. AD24]|nr:hypothetical protein bAD24_III09125 [Burkholderia sp. AD24]